MRAKQLVRYPAAKLCWRAITAQVTCCLGSMDGFTAAATVLLDIEDGHGFIGAMQCGGQQAVDGCMLQHECCRHGCYYCFLSKSSYWYVRGMPAIQVTSKLDSKTQCHPEVGE